MENKLYNEITEIGLGKQINKLALSIINDFQRTLKKGKEFGNPDYLFLTDGKLVIVPTIGNEDKEVFAAYLKIVGQQVNASAIFMISESSMWKGTHEEFIKVKNELGDIHGHPYATDIFNVTIYYQDKQITGFGDVVKKGNKRVLKPMQWNVQDAKLEEESTIFSNLLAV